MFGYATDETPEFMPLTHALATQLGARLTQVRVEGICKWVRPDGKTQVVVEYRMENGAMVPLRVHTVVISTQHDESVTNEQIRADLQEHVIKPVIPAKYLTPDTIYHLNPSWPLRHWRAARRRWTDRAQDHHRHVRRLGRAWRRRVQRQGSDQGGPLGRVRRALDRQVAGGRPAGAPRAWCR